MASSRPMISHSPPRTIPSPPSIIEPCCGDDQLQPHSSPNAALLSPDSCLRVPSPNKQLLQPPGTMSSPNEAQADGGLGGAGNTPNPFNFQTQFISTSPVKSNIGQRRGHRYKHSSISAQHQIFQEPPPRAPPVLPASLPIPTVREAWSSMRSDQRARLYWCLCHAAVAVYVFFSASGSLAMTALSHLVFFDVGSAAICVAVDVLGNFEVWRRSSVRHPFGLQRAEVLAGFAMSIFLVFGGFDLLSHNMKHVLESLGSSSHDDLDHHYHHDHHRQPAQSHGAHSHRGHGAMERVGPGMIDMASLAAIAATLVSAYGLKNHGRIRKMMRVAYPSYLSSLLPPVLENPFHFLTLLFSFVMLLLPLLSVRTFAWFDTLVCAAIAISMFVLGARLAVAQGLMLLMSYRDGLSRNGSAPATGPAKIKQGGDARVDIKTTTTGSNNNCYNITAPVAPNESVSAVVREIEAEPNIARVEEAQFWQVHYGLCMANLKICVVKGCDDGALSQLRTRISRVIQNRLGEGYGRGGSLRWEVTLQTSTDPRT